MSHCYDKFTLDDIPDSFQMWQGLRGPYFTPHVAENGDLNWSNNGQLPNPETVNIKGPPGSPGPGVPPGGTTGQILAKASDEDNDTEWIDQSEMDAGHVSYDPTETYDDGTVGKELGTINSALTSLASVTEIIDTASGAIASFPDGAGLPMRSLLAQINPVQDLHGYDAPWAGGAGKNLLNLDFTNDSGTVAGMTFTHGESYITLKGTASGTSYATFNLRTPIPADLNTDYTYSLTISGTCPGGLYGIEFNNGATLVQRFRCNTTDATSKTLQISSAFDSVTFKIEGLTSGLVFDCEIKIQFEKGSTKTTWQTYSNECPITGWTGLSGARTGVNQWDEDWEVGDISSATGQNEGNDNLIRSKNYIPITGGSAYYAKVGTVTGNLRARFYDSSKTYIGYQDKSGAIVQCNASFTAPDNASYMRFATPAGYGNTYGNDISINYPSTDTAYHAYTSLPITVSWQTEAGTVYGGTVDVVSGVLVADMGIKTDLWKNMTSETAVGSTLIRRQTSIASAQGSFTNKERTISNVAPFDATIARESVHVSMASSGNYLYAILPQTTDPDLEITFCYPLATPQTYQLTPQQINTLLGNNTVFVDCGAVSVTYQASIKGYIDKVLAS